MIRFSFALLLLTPAITGAQGTLSGQGFGYPAGQLSARAAATGGALGAFDQVSAVNPSSVAQWARSVVFFHIEPEYRSTTAGGVSSSTSVSRFPLVGGAAHISKRGVLGLTFSTYLDRTWQTVAVSQDAIGQDTIDLTTRYSSSGAINDLRLAFAWTFSEKVHAGIGVHRYAGENRLNISWDFPDSVPFGDVTENSTLSYGGAAASIGADWKLATHFGVGGYARLGGSASMQIGDTVISRGDMPNHLGAGAWYDGIAGTLVAAGWERIEWSAMESLGSVSLRARDATRLSIGAETRGPPLGRVPVFIRAGASRRSLPFDALGLEVKETVFSAGAGYALARGLANIDIGMQHARRSAGAGHETAWLWTFGLAISP